MIITLNSGFIEHLPSSKQHSKCFLFINSFKRTTIQGTGKYLFFFVFFKALLKGQREQAAFALKNLNLKIPLLAPYCGFGI